MTAAEPELRDISVTLNPGTPEWPGDTAFSCGWAWTIAGGASVNVSSVTSSPHVGTHADAPLHIRDGWPGSHELSLNSYFGPAIVLDVTSSSEEISLEELESVTPLPWVERLLLKTGRTIATGVFPESWPSLSESCVRALLGRGLRLLGMDSPSVDQRESKSLPVHNMLFAGNAAILENLDLRRVPPDVYELMAFPLKLMALDAAPVRAVLRQIAP
ncbi:MAG TPA: cyclase family protein [Gemmatimonadaceae bacterium]|nr:cyclase family protein [Gemmatimonadaceae bacterium]